MGEVLEEEEEDEDEEEQGPVAQVIEAWKKFSEGAGVNSGALVPIANVFGSRLSNGSSKRRDPNMVFVAGATGQTGARISQKLLRQGLNVRGGVRDIYVAQQLAEFATQYGVSGLCSWHLRVKEEERVGMEIGDRR